MGLLDLLRRLLFGWSKPRSPKTAQRAQRRKPRRRPALIPLRHSKSASTWDRNATLIAPQPPYAFARLVVGLNPRIATGASGFLDLSRDGDDACLARLGLPAFHTPEELARWLAIPVGRLAWLVHRFSDDSRPKSEAEAHYHFRWIEKRRGGRRLIESPKRTLKQVQRRILREILDKIAPHSSVHGFTPGRSIVSNAKPHVGSSVIVKFDLANFYPSVTFARVTAIFRSLGYCREAAIWLARLTTSALPGNIPFLKQEPSAVLPYLRRHLPQGAPTSPALANLSAYSLDVRLAGLARTFGAAYTRYADDLAFSGPPKFGRSLRTFVSLVQQIIRSERFQSNRAKRRVLRSNGALVVTGVVVNEKINVRRRDFDRLKAVLTNCVRMGPLSQNRAGEADFPAHLRGCIAHVSYLSPARGAKLAALYERIDWRR